MAPPYLSELTIRSYFLNMILIPNNYRSLIPGQENSAIIPQSTTLALEEQFFWIFPVILKFINLRVMLAIISVLIFIFSITSLPNNYGMYWGYIYLPGVLFMFLLGSLLRLIQTTLLNKKTNKRMLYYLMILNVCTFFYLFHVNLLFAPYVPERITSVLCAPIIIWVLSVLKRRKWDDILGNLSYGVFLNHFVLISIFDKYAIFSTHQVVKSFSVLLLSFFYSGLTWVCFEKRIQEFRLKTREHVRLFFYSRFGSPPCFVQLSTNRIVYMIHRDSGTKMLICAE